MLIARPFLLVTSEELALRSRRRGFWLRIARERANLTQGAAAKALGLSGQSKSTMSAWEAGTREPSPSKLEAMARLYDVQVELFMNPEPTAFERVDERLDEIARLAAQRERRDWESAEVRDQEDGGGPDDGRRKAS